MSEAETNGLLKQFTELKKYMIQLSARGHLTGMCLAIRRMYINDVITRDHYTEMFSLLNDASGRSLGGYWFEKGELAPRVNYINDLIEEGIIN